MEVVSPAQSRYRTTVIAFILVVALFLTGYVFLQNASPVSTLCPAAVALPCINSTAPVKCPTLDGDPAINELYTEAPVETVKNALTRSLYLATRLGYNCQNIIPFGAGDKLGGEGAWPICLDYWRARPDCEVYSFGINNDFSFDDSVHKKHGCKVYSFDPTMNKPTDMDRNPNHKQPYLSEGLYGKKNDAHEFANGQKTNPPWKVDTLKGFMERFGTKRIDYLKIDIEYSEWSALRTALDDGSLANVDQIGFEIHFWANERDEPKGTPKIEIIQRWNEVLEDLHRTGWRMWYSHTNPMSTNEKFEDLGIVIPCCYEIVYVNTNVKI